MAYISIISVLDDGKVILKKDFDTNKEAIVEFGYLCALYSKREEGIYHINLVYTDNGLENFVSITT